MSMGTRLHELYEAGTAPWLDNIRRGWLRSGRFREMLDQGVVGVTTNPTIFQKAFTDTDDYDDAFRDLAGMDATEAFFELAIEDVREAADQMAEIHERTGGLDGRVSFELPPSMANDTQASTRAAADFFRRIDRPAAFIKIPGTSAGPEAIEESIANGINVNVTLLFAIDSYAAVHEAYMRGLERRIEAGQPIERLYSVASFFVSRVDTAVDKMLPEGSPLRGTVAVANAKLAYQRFLEMIDTERWRAIAAQGGNVQRPLWASTGTKNPAYADVLYVDTLIGPDTVNTMPEGTIEAVLDHGRVDRTVDADTEQARQTIERLEEEGISLEQVTQQLQVDGVAAFGKSFDELIAALDEQLSAVGAR
jgi:transaldolase